MKKRFFLIFLIILILSIVFSLAACSSAYSESDNESPSIDTSAGIETVSKDSTQKIIYSVSATIVVNDIIEATNKIKQLLPEGSWSDSEELSNSSATYVFRVRTEYLDSFVSTFNQAGDVSYFNRSSTNITNSYSTLESTKASLEAELERLEYLQSKAETVKDLLEISARVTVVTSQLNDINKALSNYDSLMDYSVVRISLYSTKPINQQTFGERIASAFKGAWEAVVAFAGFLVVAAVAIVPFLLIIVPVLVLIIFAVRISKKRKNIKNNK